jgi:polyhydroxyalkanoate synthesis regulator phasin
MRGIIVVVALGMLAGCGPDAATTAATSAAIKKREIEEGRKTTEQTRQKVDQLLEQGQQRNREQDAEK